MKPSYGSKVLYFVLLLFSSDRLTEQEVTSDDSVPREEHETMREQLRSDIKHQKELLEEALRKQDELALEAAHAWQKVGGRRSKSKTPTLES